MATKCMMKRKPGSVYKMYDDVLLAMNVWVYTKRLRTLEAYTVTRTTHMCQKHDSFILLNTPFSYKVYVDSANLALWLAMTLWLCTEGFELWWCITVCAQPTRVSENDSFVLRNSQYGYKMRDDAANLVLR